MERSGRSLRPTAAGEAYVPYVIDVLGLLEQGARAAREATDAAQRTLRVGAVTTAGEYLLAPLLRTFRDAHPDLEITLHVGNRENVFALLLAHDLDLAITGRPPEELALHARAFAPNEFVLIAAPSDPLAKMQSVGVEELAQRSWLLREPGSGTRTMCEEYLAEHALSPRILTLGSNGAIKQASAMGLGVALQSRIAVELELELGVLATINVRGGLPKRAWHVVHPAVGPQRSEVRTFEEFVESRTARQLLTAPLTTAR